jgi:hypothetical protein
MTLTEPLEPFQLRRVFGFFPTGVTALAAVLAGRPQGIAVSAFTPVSLEPAMLLVCVARSSTTWPSLSKAPRLGISVLAADQERACRQLSARDGDRFADLDWRTTDNGAVLLEGASAWFECSVEQLCAGWGPRHSRTSGSRPGRRPRRFSARLPRQPVPAPFPEPCAHSHSDNRSR